MNITTNETAEVFQLVVDNSIVDLAETIELIRIWAAQERPKDAIIEDVETRLEDLIAYLVGNTKQFRSAEERDLSIADLFKMIKGKGWKDGQ